MSKSRGFAEVRGLGPVFESTPGGSGWAFYDGEGERYRLALGRSWGKPGDTSVLWVMLNPSWATAVRDDRTVAKCRGFSKRWGFGELAIVNLFAWRTEDPNKLRPLGEEVAIGPGNDRVIRELADRSDHIICAWGNGGRLWDRGRKVLDGALAGRELWATRINKSGHPAHPLYQPWNIGRTRFW